MRSPPPTRVARRGGVPRGSSDAGEKWKALVREGSEAAALEMCRRRHRGERRRSCDRRRHLCRRPQRPPPAHATVSDGVGGGEATDTTPTRSVAAERVPHPMSVPARWSLSNLHGCMVSLSTLFDRTEIRDVRVLARRWATCSVRSSRWRCFHIHDRRTDSPAADTVLPPLPLEEAIKNQTINGEVDGHGVTTRRPPPSRAHRCLPPSYACRCSPPSYARRCCSRRSPPPTPARPVRERGRGEGDAPSHRTPAPPPSTAHVTLLAPSRVPGEVNRKGKEGKRRRKPRREKRGNPEARSPLLGVATAAAAAASLARRSGSAETPRSKPRRASTYTAAADWDEPASPDDDAKFDATMAAPLRTRPRRRQQPPEDDRHWNASGRGAGDGARRSYPIPSPAT
ncbi:hypothetical protein DAI22_09g036301 [Oryza sativa Japonica Group]|nr:hypothetical protein DAI22_09g036301 [Oryza sativa Japonica Group]